MLDTIETELTVSSIFDPYFHVTNNGKMVDISRNSEVIINVVSALESENCGNTYNRHNVHCDKDTAWYDYVDINSINIPTHYEPLPATEEILNDTKVIIIPDDQTQKRDNTSSVNKLEDPHQY